MSRTMISLRLSITNVTKYAVCYRADYRRLRVTCRQIFCRDFSAHTPGQWEPASIVISAPMAAHAVSSSLLAAFTRKGRDFEPRERRHDYSGHFAAEVTSRCRSNYHFITPLTISAPAECQVEILRSQHARIWPKFRSAGEVNTALR